MNIKKKNKLIILLSVLIILLSVLISQYDSLFKKSEIIWNNSGNTNKDIPYVSKIDIYEESCNKVVYEIFYKNVKKIMNEKLDISVSHKEVNSGYAKKADGTIDYSKWINSEGGKGLRGLAFNTPVIGDGSIKYTSWITPQTKSAETDDLTVMIRTFDEKDNQIQSFKEVNLKRFKSWNNDCL
jgi:hypothetical protein